MNDPLTVGLRKHPLYPVWAGMIQRCENPGQPAYRYYGGRIPPITVWDPWHSSGQFIADVEAEIGPRPPGLTPGGRPLYSLDRIKNHLGYRPGNIQWSTWPQQRRNQGDSTGPAPTD